MKYGGTGEKILVGACEAEDGVQFYVRDFGGGIPSEHLPRLFERFYRVDKARSRESGGTGLGLAIAKHIVRAHGGPYPRRERTQSRLNLLFHPAQTGAAGKCLIASIPRSLDGEFNPTSHSIHRNLTSGAYLEVNAEFSLQFRHHPDPLYAPSAGSVTGP